MSKTRRIGLLGEEALPLSVVGVACGRAAQIIKGRVSRGLNRGGQDKERVAQSTAAPTGEGRERFSAGT